MNDSKVAFVLGAGGLLGSEILKELQKSHRIYFQKNKIPWLDRDRAVKVLDDELVNFFLELNGQSWILVWCAGVGFPGVEVRLLEDEEFYLNRTLEIISKFADPENGVIFFASSAGALYQNDGLPHSELSQVKANSYYGEHKFKCENYLKKWNSTFQTKVLIGRISTLYGPHQNQTKSQGLIWQLCMSIFTGKPQIIYASQDTMRDFIYSEDCARKILLAINMIEKTSLAEDKVVIKVFASMSSISIGGVLNIVNRRLFNKPKYLIVNHKHEFTKKSIHVFQSTIWDEIDNLELTPLNVGIENVIRSIEYQIQHYGISYSENLN